MKYYSVDLQLKEGIFGDVLDDLDDYIANGDIKISLDNERFKTDEGRCFNYALNNKELNTCVGGYNMIKRRRYEPIDKKSVKIGDLVTYHQLSFLNNKPCAENCQHFAVVSDIKISLTTGKTIIYIKSKWGDFPIYEGPLDLLPECYGNSLIFWGKCSVRTEKVRNLRRETENLTPLTAGTL